MKSPAIKPSIKPDIIELLTHGPMTTTQLANRIGCTPAACGLVMRSNPGFYVKDWTKTGQQIWVLGTEPHAPRPKAPKKTYRKRDMVAVDMARLAAPLVQSERVWGI